MEDQLIVFGHPPRQTRRQYSYAGARLLGRASMLDRLVLKQSRQAVYLHDSLADLPSLILGTSTRGKTEKMIADVFQGATKGRPQIIMDAKVNMDTVEKLAYFAKRAGRPFYAVFPIGRKILGHTWSPLVCPGVSQDAIREAIFDSFQPPESEQKKGVGVYFYDKQKAVFRLLWRLFEATGHPFNLRDLLAAFKHPECFEVFGRMADLGIVRGEYQELLNRRNEDKDFKSSLEGFVNWLSKFDGWVINSENPDVVLPGCIDEGAVVYFGLPINVERDLGRTLGKVLMNQLHLLSATAQLNRGGRRNQVDIFIDEAWAFIDEPTANWVCQGKTSGFRLRIMIQTKADLDQFGQAFSERIRANAANVWLFNPSDYKTAREYASLFGGEWEESEHSSLRGRETYRVNPDWILALRRGQCFYRPAEIVRRPYLLATPLLFDAPVNCYWSRTITKTKTPLKKEPLNTALRIIQAKSQIHKSDV
jgi:hypothetical protein